MWSGGTVAPREASEEVPEMRSFESFIAAIGNSGRRSVTIFVLCSWCSSIMTFQMMSYQFLGKQPDHWCAVEPLMKANWSQEEIKQVAVPRKNDEEYEGCLLYNLNFDQVLQLGFERSLESRDSLFLGEINDTRECRVRVFSPEAPITLSSEWDLVCDRLALYSTTHSMGQVGILVGAISFGYLLDRFGRRRSILWGIVGYALTGLATAASPNLPVYMLLRVVVTACGYGMYLGGFVLGMELCTTEQRRHLGSLFTIPFSVAIALLALLAYLVRPWRWLQVVLTLPIVSFIPYFWLLPESPRWLLLEGNLSEFIRTTTKMADSNGRQMPDEDKIKRLMNRMQLQERRERSIQTWKEFLQELGLTFTSMVRLKEYRWLSVNVFFSWLVVSFAYYGVSFSSFNIGCVFIYVLRSFAGTAVTHFPPLRDEVHQQKNPNYGLLRGQRSLLQWRRLHLGLCQ